VNLVPLVFDEISINDRKFMKLLMQWRLDEKPELNMNREDANKTAGEILRDQLRDGRHS
jgi:hypothetical protein